MTRLAVVDAVADCGSVICEISVHTEGAKMAIRLKVLRYIAAALMLLWPSVGGAFDLYVCAGLEELEGDVTAPGYERCSSLQSAGESTRLTDGRLVVRPFQIIKTVDDSSAGWRQHLLMADPIPELEIKFVGPDGGGGTTDHIVITMTQAVVLAISASIFDGGVPVESISVEPQQRIEWEFPLSEDLVTIDLGKLK
jgi:type VI protein secretion system component Hcp